MSAKEPRGQEKTLERQGRLDSLLALSESELTSLLDSVKKGVEESKIEVAVEASGISFHMNGEFIGALRIGSLDTKSIVESIVTVLGTEHDLLQHGKAAESKSGNLELPEKYEPILNKIFNFFDETGLADYLNFAGNVASPTVSLSSLKSNILSLRAFSKPIHYAQVAFQILNQGERTPVSFVLTQYQLNRLAKEFSSLSEEIDKSKQNSKVSE